MRTLFFYGFFVLIPTVLSAKPGTSCLVPLSVSGKVVTFEPVEPALPLAVTKAAQIGNAISTTVSAVRAAGATQISQGTRADIMRRMVACTAGSEPDQGAPSWLESPTQLSIGDTGFQYDLGTILGNWAIMAGSGVIWGVVARRLGAAESHFPGGLAIPGMIVAGPTVTSAVNLLRKGSTTQKFIGGCSLIAQSLGGGLVTLFLHPKFFKARWALEPEPGWVDDKVPGYVGRHILLFEDYRGGRQWFVANELLMSMILGSLQSWHASKTYCLEGVTSSAVLSSLYALSLGLLSPNAEHNEYIFFTAIASIQAAAMSAQAISLWLAPSEEKQQKVRAVTESIMVATEWMLFAKTVFDIFKDLRGFYQRFRAGSAPQQDSLEMQLFQPQYEENAGSSESRDPSDEPDPDGILFFAYVVFTGDTI